MCFDGAKIEKKAETATYSEEFVYFCDGIITYKEIWTNN